MSLLKKLAGQTAVYGLPTIIAKVLNYLLVPMYTRIFLAEEYGVVTHLYAYVGFLAVILTYGMETAFFRFSTKNNNSQNVYNTAAISLIISSIFFIVSAIVFSHPIANAMDYAHHPEYISWFAIILGLDAMRAIPFAYLRQQNKAKRFAFIKSTDIAINIGMNLFFLIACPLILKNSNNTIICNLINSIYHKEIGVGYIFISNLIASGVSILLLLPEFLSIRFKFDKTLWKSMFIYAFPIMIWGMSGMINETFDRIIMKHMIPEAENPMKQLGIYGACYKLSIIMSLFVQAFKFAAEPFFFSYSKNQDSKQVYADVMKYFVIACSFIFLGMMMYFDIAIKFIGIEYRAGASIVPILLIANMFLGIFYNLSIWYKLTDQTKYGAYISIIGAVVTIILNILLIPTMGYMGAAWTTLISYTLIMALSYLLGQKHYPIPYNIVRISFYIISAVLLYFITKYLNIVNVPLKYIVHTLVLGIYILVVYLLEVKKIRIGKI